MKQLVKFYWDCGRQGEVEGLFATTDEALEFIIGKTVYFGEILGKHSDVSGTIEETDFTVVSQDQEFITKLVSVIGKETVSGFNPFHYLEN